VSPSQSESEDSWLLFLLPLRIDFVIEGPNETKEPSGEWSPPLGFRSAFVSFFQSAGLAGCWQRLACGESSGLGAVVDVGQITAGHIAVACSRVSRDRARCVLPKSSNEEHMLRHDFYTKHSHKQSGPKNAVPATNILMAEKRMRPVLRVCGGSNGRSSSRCCRR